MKITLAVLYALYFMALDADDFWTEQLAKAKTNRWGTAARAVYGYTAKVAADKAYLSAAQQMRQQVAL